MKQRRRSSAPKRATSSTPFSPALAASSRQPTQLASASRSRSCGECERSVKQLQISGQLPMLYMLAQEQTGAEGRQMVRVMQPWPAAHVTQ